MVDCMSTDFLISNSVGVSLIVVGCLGVCFGCLFVGLVPVSMLWWFAGAFLCLLVGFVVVDGVGGMVC